MKKSELKEIVKECIKDVLFEEGMLSSLIAEIAIGINQAQSTIVEKNTFQQEQVKNQVDFEKQKRLLETKKKMLNAIGNEKMSKVFEGTEPLRGSSQSAGHSPLAGKDPNDAGVDISALFSFAGQKWNNLK